jgi:hypothetical protein
MNKWIGIALALTALIGGGLLYGWQGLVLGVTIVSFWLLLQFSRFIRVMRIAAEGPMGQIDNAVMLSTKMPVRYNWSSCSSRAGSANGRCCGLKTRLEFLLASLASSAKLNRGLILEPATEPT